MYSREESLKAVELDVKYDKSAAATASRPRAPAGKAATITGIASADGNAKEPACSAQRRNSPGGIRMKSFHRACALSLLLVLSPLFAGLSPAAAAEEADSSEWRFSVTPYVWACGVVGTVGAGGASVTVKLRATAL